MAVGLRVGLRAALAASLAVGCGVDELGGGKVLVVVAGQSNSTMLALTSGLADQSFAASYPNVRMVARMSGGIADPPVFESFTERDLDSVTFQAADRIGLSASMMRDLDRARPGGFALAHFGLYGAFASNFDPNGSYPTTPPILFDQFITYVQEAKTQLGCSRVVIVWEHGESDSTTAPLAAAYDTWLLGFIDAVRAELGDVPFVYGQLNSACTYGAFTTELRASQAAIEGDRDDLVMVDQDSVSLSGDNTHYDANGCVAIGHLFAGAVADALGIHIPPLASFDVVVDGLEATFTNTSISPSDAITTYLWDMGGAGSYTTGTSASASPVFEYTSSGDYSVTLTVTNAAGQVNTSDPVNVWAGGIAGVTFDATSGIGVPVSAAEWGTFLTAISSTADAPEGLWLLQEASGNAADSIGAIALTTLNAPLYQQSVTGWARKMVGWGEGQTKSFASTNAGLPDIASASFMVLAYIVAAAPISPRNLIHMGTPSSTRASLDASTSTRVRTFSATSTTTGGSDPYGTTPRPYVLKVDRTGGTIRGYTDQEKVTGSYNAGMSGKGLAIGAGVAGGSPLGSCSGGVLYMAAWYGAEAEMTDAEVKAILVGLGWTVPWS